LQAPASSINPKTDSSIVGNDQTAAKLVHRQR